MPGGTDPVQFVAGCAWIDTFHHETRPAAGDLSASWNVLAWNACGAWLGSTKSARTIATGHTATHSQPQAHAFTYSHTVHCDGDLSR